MTFSSRILSIGIVLNLMWLSCGTEPKQKREIWDRGEFTLFEDDGILPEKNSCRWQYVERFPALVKATCLYEVPENLEVKVPMQKYASASGTYVVKTAESKVDLSFSVDLTTDVVMVQLKDIEEKELMFIITFNGDKTVIDAQRVDNNDCEEAQKSFRRLVYDISNTSHSCAVHEDCVRYGFEPKQQCSQHFFTSKTVLEPQKENLLKFFQEISRYCPKTEEKCEKVHPEFSVCDAQTLTCVGIKM